MGELIKREAAAHPLEFGGERLTGAIGGQVEIEHYHRYLLARDLCRGRDVLDVAAGEGYGTALLAQVAASAVGVELDGRAVEAARAEFERANLRYEQGDARALPLADGSFDVVVSFETLEHLAEQDVFLSEIRRVLRPGGLLVISTPDRDVYSSAGQAANPFHVLELTQAEFEALLRRHFEHVAVAWQRPMIGSVILGGASDAPLRSFERRGADMFEGSDGLPRAPYLVAFASAAALPALPNSVLVHRHDLDTDPRMRAEAEAAQREAEAAQLGAEAARRVAEDGRAASMAETRRAEAQAQDAVARAAAAAERRVLAAEHAERRAEVLSALAAARQERAAHRAMLSAERAVLAQARCDGLELLLTEARQQTAAVQAAAADAAAAAEAHHAALRAAAGAREDALAADLRRLQSSTAWKATWPARRAGARFPGLAKRMRQGAQVLWWTGTLQLPRRFVQWRRHRRLRLEAPVAPVPALPEPVALRTLPELPPARPPIALRLAAEPEVSIVIPTYGQVEATLACLRSIADSPPSCAIEVIVVDDAYPGPEDLGPLRDVTGIVLLRNAENLGYLRSCNHAVATARGTFVHLLNNDTELRPGAVDALLAVFGERPQAGLVGSKLVYPDGRLQEAGGIIWADASGWNYGRGDDPGLPQYNFIRPADYVSGASIMLRRALWTSLGGYDEAFLPAYYEDADLAFRVREAGFEVLYAPASEVVHFEGASHGTDLTAGIKAFQEVNQATMTARWVARLEAEGFRPGEHVMRAAARARHRTTILVIDHYVPEPDRDAGSRSTMGILTSLVDAGWLVKFWPHNRVYSATYTPPLERIGIEVVDARWPGDLGAWLRQHGGELDHVMAIRPDIATELLPYLLGIGAVLSFYGVDLHFARMRRQAELDGSEELRRASEGMERRERRVWRSFDIVIYPSEEEAAVVRSMDPGATARGIVPFWFDAAAPRPVPPAERTILFVAGFAHPPNVDAALFLCDDIMPRLEASIGPVKVTLAGSGPSAEVRALGGRDVEVTGYVTDVELEALYARHRVAVVPLRFGAGVKGKVVEALSRGLPLVTTSIGAQGIVGLESIVPVRDESQDIADALARLLLDDVAWAAQSKRQVGFAERRFSRAAMGRSVLAALARAPGSPPAE